LITVLQAVSGEMDLKKLIDTLMRTAIEQAGAERGLLILSRGAMSGIEAEAKTAGDTVRVELVDAPVTAGMLPESILQFVLRTRENMILDDASVQNSFSGDPYFLQHHARSILCLPLITQAKLSGALYLENNLAPRVFAPGRVATLKLLASQAAIALENTRLYLDLQGLYRDLAEREAKIRRLVEANIIGIFIGDLEGRIIEANDAFLQIVDYDRADLSAGRIRWTDLTPPEWQVRDAQAAEELRIHGTARPYEKEYYRKDGSRVPILLGAATFEEGGNHGVAFVLDLTEREHAADTLREMQMELAHANRVATMGQLTASIAHEVRQPIAATVTNAQSALRWMDGRPPDLEEVRQALRRIVQTGFRAGEIVDRIRALTQKAPPRKDQLSINGAVREVIELTRGEATKYGVSVQTDLTDGLPLISGDRVQLQQVMLNLIVNAVEAMSGVSEDARELRISTGADVSGGVCVAVRDSGSGLAPAGLERAFDPFYTTKPGGLGMGLSICHSIIEAHGGRLWASANANGGATFQFTLPAHSDGTS